MTGGLLLVECEPLGTAVAALKHAPGVLEVAIFGNAFHVIVRDTDAALPVISAFLPQRASAAAGSRPSRSRSRMSSF